MKNLRYRRQVFFLQRFSLDDILWPTDGVSFTSHNIPVKDRCLKILFVQVIVGQFVFSVDGKDIVTPALPTFEFSPVFGDTLAVDRASTLQEPVPQRSKNVQVN